MKHNLNTRRQRGGNPAPGVGVSERATSTGKRTRTALALAIAGLVASPAVRSAETVIVPVGEVVNNVTLNAHDTQILFGEAQGTVINTGLEFGPDNETNIGGQFVQSGGLANQTTLNTGGLQFIDVGGRATDTTINAGSGQSVKGQSTGTQVNGGEQWVQDGGIARDTVINAGGQQFVKTGAHASGTTVNTGSQGGPNAESTDGQWVRGDASDTTINANGRQVILQEGTASGTTVYAGGDQSVHGRAAHTVLDGGYQYIHAGAFATETVINSGGWQVLKDGAVADNTTVNASGKLQVNAGGTATQVTQQAGGALVTSTAATVSGTNRLGNFSVDATAASATHVLLENGGRLDVLGNGFADTTTVDRGGVLAVARGGSAVNVVMNDGGALIADSDSTVSGTNAHGEFIVDAASGQARGLWLENGGQFTVRAGGSAENTTVGSHGELSVGTGGRLNGTTRLIEQASLTVTGDVISTGTLDNAGTITFVPAQDTTVSSRLMSASADSGLTPYNVAEKASDDTRLKHSESEHPVNWWVRPSVIRTFSSDGDLSMGTATAGSNITFTPSQEGTSVDVQAGVEAFLRQNVTLGVQAGYARSVSGNSADGYNAQATLKVAF